MDSRSLRIHCGREGDLLRYAILTADPRKFLQTHEYKNLSLWTKEIGERAAVKRGRMVNRTSGPPEEQLHERHDACDFVARTQDKIGAG
jgi:GSH-dependent disulfide-bond oxidoreductase